MNPASVTAQGLSKRHDRSSRARGPKTPIALDQRSWATMASCQADRRALSDVASLVPKPEPTIKYGFMSHPPSLKESRSLRTLAMRHIRRGFRGQLGQAVWLP